MITINNVTREQLSVVQKLAYRIWPVTFEKILSAEQIDYMLDWIYSMPALKRQFDSGHQFIVAMEDEQCIGYAAYEMLDATADTKLHKIYILPALQGRGVGKILINELINRAKHEGKKHLLLNVNRYNQAILFYEKLGFNIIRSEDIPIGNGFFMNDYVMAMNI